MKHRPDFAHQLEHMARDGRKLIELGYGPEMHQISVYNHEIVLLEKQCRVITFYDIQAEIEQKEIEAWYKLIRILTHEIMNSTTPLISLTETILMLLEDEKGDQKDLEKITNQNIRDVRFSVNTIKNRSEGILKFVEAYRKLTDIPHPEFDTVPLVELFQLTTALLEAELKRRKIQVQIKVEPESLCIFCDRSLMDQVLINLMTNSMYALDLQDKPVIRMSAFEGPSRISILIEDNGKGIDPDILQKVFIPFFSTREGGSGIGLSFSKFVILQHGGRIKLESRKNEFTKCTIDLPKE
jgi:nitrogen fixation/metabolism regulation signal transduction histidine kinase